ncbi:hypothetical protein ACVW1A_003517 [Bradyrhizobium sp. LB1.3]
MIWVEPVAQAPFCVTLMPARLVLVMLPSLTMVMSPVPRATAARPTVPVAEPSLVTLTSPPPLLKAPIAVPAAVIDESAPVVTVTLPSAQVNASMP